MTDTIPVLLIQTLHDRQATLTHELQALEDVRKREVQIKTELAHIATLLRNYPALGEDQERPEDLSLPPEARPAMPLAEERPADRSLRDYLNRALKGPDRLNTEERPADPSVLDSLDAILREKGPSPAVYLKRRLRDHYGLDVPDSTLHGLLNRAKNVGHYAKRGKLWRLVSLNEAPTPGPPS